MFVRFRPILNRLQVSLAETRRIDGKVRQQHVAALGSVPVPPSINDRLAFWAALHQRFARLSNRISADDHHRLMAAIHERVPMAMTDEQRGLQRENAEHDLTLSSVLDDLHTSLLADLKGHAAALAKKIADLEASAAATALSTDAARERLAKIDRGEEVSGGLGKPTSLEDILRANGWTTADMEHCRVLNDLGEIGAFEEYMAEVRRRVGSDKPERAIARALLRRRAASLLG